MEAFWVLLWITSGIDHSIMLQDKLEPNGNRAPQKQMAKAFQGGMITIGENGHKALSIHIQDKEHQQLNMCTSSKNPQFLSQSQDINSMHMFMTSQMLTTGATILLQTIRKPVMLKSRTISTICTLLVKEKHVKGESRADRNTDINFYEPRKCGKH